MPSHLDIAGITTGIAASGYFTPAMLVDQMKANAQPAPPEFDNGVAHLLADHATVLYCKGPTPALTPCVGVSLKVDIFTDDYFGEML